MAVEQGEIITVERILANEVQGVLCVNRYVPQKMLCSRRFF